MRQVVICEKMRILSMLQSHDQSTSMTNSSHNRTRFQNYFDHLLHFWPLESIKMLAKWPKNPLRSIGDFAAVTLLCKQNALYLVSLFRAWSELNFDVWNVCNKLCLGAQWCAENEQKVVNIAYAQLFSRFSLSSDANFRPERDLTDKFNTPK